MINRYLVYTAAIAVWLACFHLFLLATGLYEGKFDNESIGWYILAKGIFCSVSLVLARSILEEVRNLHLSPPASDEEGPP
jgi:hypothetical protein